MSAVRNRPRPPRTVTGPPSRRVGPPSFPAPRASPRRPAPPCAFSRRRSSVWAPRDSLGGTPGGRGFRGYAAADDKQVSISWGRRVPSWAALVMVMVAAGSWGLGGAAAAEPRARCPDAVAWSPAGACPGADVLEEVARGWREHQSSGDQEVARDRPEHGHSGEQGGQGDRGGQDAARAPDHLRPGDPARWRREWCGPRHEGFPWTWFCHRHHKPKPCPTPTPTPTPPPKAPPSPTPKPRPTPRPVPKPRPTVRPTPRPAPPRPVVAARPAPAPVAPPKPHPAPKPVPKPRPAPPAAVHWPAAAPPPVAPPRTHRRSVMITMLLTTVPALLAAAVLRPGSGSYRRNN